MSEDRRHPLLRTRWAAIGAAVAVSLGAGGVIGAHAAGGGASSFVPVTPCRMFDSRADSSVGGRTTPIHAGETVALTVRGAQGNCNVGADAVGVAANVTTVNGTAASFLSIWPADVSQPLTSTNNWIAGQAATPNKVDVMLSADGRIDVFNAKGDVDVIIDVVGYYVGVAAAAPTTPAPTPAPAPAQGIKTVTMAAKAVQVNPTEIGAVTVNAPSAGVVFVAVEADTVTLFGNGPITSVCDLTTGTATGSTARNFLAPGATPTHYSMTKTFTVPAGATTIKLLCTAPGNPQVQGVLTAVYSAGTV